MPCLLLVAEYDIKTIKESMYMWKRSLPNSQFHVVENVGHNYFFDAAEQVNSIVKAFIAVGQEVQT